MKQAVNIKESQRLYLNLLKRYQSTIISERVSSFVITKLLDDVACFWLDRIEIVDLELEYISSNFDCFMLSGAIYLNVEAKRHYFLKAIGDYHFINDPLLKLENFFRHPEFTNEKANISLFQRAFSDTIEVLNNYNAHLFVLPLNLLFTMDEAQRMGLIHSWFLKFMSHIFSQQFNTAEDFFDKFSTYSEIEEKMLIVAQEYLFYSSVSNEQTIKSIIEEHCKSMRFGFELSDAKKFF